MFLGSLKEAFRYDNYVVSQHGIVAFYTKFRFLILYLAYDFHPPEGGFFSRASGQRDGAQQGRPLAQIVLTGTLNFAHYVECSGPGNKNIISVDDENILLEIPFQGSVQIQS